MFAKPHWFRIKTIGHGVTPANWRGWLYVTGVVVLTALPTLLLLGRHQGLEALIWLAVIGGFLFYEFRQIRRAISGCHTSADRAVEATVVERAAGQSQATDDGIYFLDQHGAAQRVNTARFQLSLKQ